ncbi:MAG: histidine kinase [Bryobacteraceae bacterium]|nr:histidine kinase [Bryobacteraceae bacterium]
MDAEQAAPDGKAKQGKLTVILGYAAGVGKTFKMLEEGQQLAAWGHDVVVGYFEPHGRQDTIAKTEGLETVPRRVVQYREKHFEEMDTEAILARRPEIALVDEFPHTNIPGSERAKRWEDVLVLLEAGIDVITTMNIQHLESLNDQVREISGVQVRETVPDWVLKRADAIVLVDLTPGALLNRLDRGVVYAPDKAQRAKQNFFKEPTLAALRELALRQTAHEVDLRQAGTAGHGSVEAPVSSPAPNAEHERIMIHVTDAPGTAALIRRGRRVADYLRAECFAVAVVPGPGLGSIPAGKREALERHLDFARKLHIETRILDAEEAAEALVGFAHTNGITQVFLAKPERPRIMWLPAAAHRDLVMRVVRLARDLQVTVVAERKTGLQRPA